MARLAVFHKVITSAIDWEREKVKRLGWRAEVRGIMTNNDNSLLLDRKLGVRHELRQRGAFGSLMNGLIHIEAYFSVIGYSLIGHSYARASQIKHFRFEIKILLIEFWNSQRVNSQV